MVSWSRTADTTAKEEQKQQPSHPHSSTASVTFDFNLLFFSCPCLSYFHSFGLFRVRLIFTPRSRAPLTHSPILVLTPSPRPGQSENIVVFLVQKLLPALWQEPCRSSSTTNHPQSLPKSQPVTRNYNKILKSWSCWCAHLCFIKLCCGLF